MIKTFVLDTNVLLHSAGSLDVFQDNDVVIPMAVIEELDKFKKNLDELGRNARKVIRRLDALRKFGHLNGGVQISLAGHSNASGKLYVLSRLDTTGEIRRKLDETFDPILTQDSPDNRILRVAMTLHLTRPKVIFISKDINLRLKADAFGIEAMDFEREKVDVEACYCGFREKMVPQQQVEAVHKDHTIPVKEFHDMNPNEFLVLCSETHPKDHLIARLRNNEVRILPRISPTLWGISARNKEQRMAMDLLCDPEIPLVTLVGGAGTGKTLLALAAALEATMHQNLYERILVTRPIVPIGNDIGYLPGSKDSKLSSWMQPIFDNLELLIHLNPSGGKSGGKHSSGLSVDHLLNSHKIELEALTYIRGRSIPRQFVIVDEAQNLTPHEIKTIISRAGEGTKIIMTGDPHQIDNPYLDASGNGLSYSAERLKSTRLHGHILLSSSERSELAAVAARML